MPERWRYSATASRTAGWSSATTQVMVCASLGRGIPDSGEGCVTALGISAASDAANSCLEPLVPLFTPSMRPTTTPSPTGPAPGRDQFDAVLANELERQTLQAVFDAMPTGLSVADPVTHELLSVNRKFCELIGRDEADVVGQVPPFPWWDAGEDASIGFTPGGRVDRIYRLPDGRPQPVEVSVHAIAGEDGEPAAGVAHEINNPLFAILGLTEFLLKEAETGSKARERLELIQETGLEIKEIVRALLDFARENAEERHTVDLGDVVRSTVELVRRTNAHKGVELVDVYDRAEATIVASPNQLKQLFLNLIANARQAMPEGGTIHVQVRREHGWATARVSDDGQGIPPELQQRIFEPFFTTRRATGGTGLGLSVSLGIAESHGGTLTVTSAPGEGSAFTLRLPLAEEES